MKRFVLVVCMTVTVLALFACGKRKDDPQATKKLYGTKAGVDAAAGEASGHAVTIEPVSGEEAFASAEELVKDMTLEEKVGQMFLVDLSQLDPPKKAGARRYRMTDRMRESLRRNPVGGVILTEHNIKNKEQTKQLISDIKESVSGSALYIAAEEEGGGTHSLAARISEMKETGHISAARMAAEMTEQQVYEEGVKIAQMLTSWGFNMNLAPVADIASEKNLDYASRCFGGDVDDISPMIENMVEGMRHYGLAVSLKYFPGMGNIQGDYREDILDNQDTLMTLRNNNFSVYSDGIRAGADCVMMSDTAVSKITVNDKLPAFLSVDIVTDLLREEMDFEGVIMTPPLNMHAVTKNYTVDYVVVEAVRAGCDMIVMPEDIKKGQDALIGAVLSGKIDEKVINTSVRRILQDKIQRGILVLEDE